MELKSKLKNKPIQESNSKLEFKPRLQPTIVSILNLQIANELQSSQVYRSMACYLDNCGWTNAASYFFIASDEELIHMNKIYDYLFSKNCKAITPEITKVNQEFKNIRDVITKALEHEILVTEQWENIANISCESKDRTTMFFSQWFLNEQITEESKFRNLLYMIDKGTPDWYLDKKFKSIGKE